MRQIMFLKSEKTNVLEIYEVLRVLIKYNGITRNSKEENIKGVLASVPTHGFSLNFAY